MLPREVMDNNKQQGHYGNNEKNLTIIIFISMKKRKNLRIKIVKVS